MLFTLPNSDDFEERPARLEGDAISDGMRIHQAFYCDYLDLHQELCEEMAGAPSSEDAALKLLNRCLFLRFLGVDSRADAVAAFLNLFPEKAGETNGNHSWPSIFPHLISEVMEGLAQYPFSSQESNPPSRVLAVAPDVMAKAAETLAISGRATGGDAGIFYTPRLESELMCRMSLVHFLSNHMGLSVRNKLYRLIFDSSCGDCTSAEEALSMEAWATIRKLLMDVRVVDPSCGSGDFLIGMLDILDELLQRSDRILNLEGESDRRRRRIAKRSLYGVDVKEWASEATRMRLSLAAVSGESRNALAEVKSTFDGLSDNIRHGDALVPGFGSTDGILRNGASGLMWKEVFPGVFDRREAGFDIVIGNPPYVRQENIAPPGPDGGSPLAGRKQQYKIELTKATHAAFPEFFGAVTRPHRRLDKKSDLYIYFFFLGLRLLNPRGTFCFITSNSWLDVSYGAGLKDFLVRHGNVRYIFDSEAIRSFSSADVNTAIALLASPASPSNPEPARFVNFKLPFKRLIEPEIWTEIEEKAQRSETERYRLFPLNQETTSGAMIPDRAGASNPVASQKWGGMFLRAPSIYWDIVDRYSDKFVRLRDIAEVRFGIKTGANEFFYLDSQKAAEWQIEKDFLRPVIKSSRECQQILLRPADLRYQLFVCSRARSDLNGTAALRYIEHGESQQLHLRPSCAGRSRWWDIGSRRVAPIISPCSIADLPRMFQNTGVLADKRLYEVYPVDPAQTNAILLAANSTLFSLFLEIGSRTGLGEGLLDLTVYELADAYLVLPGDKDRVTAVLHEARERRIGPFPTDLHHPLRRSIDDLVFDQLGLTQSERKRIYEAVCRLVSRRLRRASSLSRGTSANR